MIPFDDYIAIDWSGSKAVLSPGIAVAKAFKDDSQVLLISPPEKEWSRARVAEWLILQAAGSKRLLVGIDSNLGYSASLVHKYLPHLQTAHELWALIEKTCHQESNFYAHAFWRESLFRDAFWIEGKKPLHFPVTRRLTELGCIDQHRGYPENPFKLIGAKQVGKGGLAAMRMAHFLKEQLQEKIAFWPFDSQEHCNEATIVILEIYPRLFLREANHGLSKVRDIKKLKELLLFYKSTTPSHSKINDHCADALIAAAGMRHWIHESNDSLNLEQCSATFVKQLRIEGWILGVSLPVESKRS
ncbi:MAG: hypothetical protein DVB29_07240 [Verrucomicrobia bacterium]|jgi:hypothetical protein|nr:MAG: hypothetical protein DVB29_07240 [Verrucomicrobiota bacterium]